MRPTTIFGVVFAVAATAGKKTILALFYAQRLTFCIAPLLRETNSDLAKRQGAVSDELGELAEAVGDLGLKKREGSGAVSDLLAELEAAVADLGLKKRAGSDAVSDLLAELEQAVADLGLRK